MRTQPSDSTRLQQAFLAKLAALWPPLKGSLAQVHKPCIRPNCPACARGDKHPAWMFAYTDPTGRRRCLYVPSALVRQLRQGLKNGRRLQQLMAQLGPALVRQARSARSAACSIASITAPSASKNSR